MKVEYEIVLRTLGVFLSVYFTLGWGEKSKPGWDIPGMWCNYYRFGSEISKRFCQENNL